MKKYEKLEKMGVFEGFLREKGGFRGVTWEKVGFLMILG